jgi:hypothetical protein
MAKNIKKIAEGLGAEIVGQVSNTGGAPGAAKVAHDAAVLSERRGTNRMAAAILARVIHPERADWSTHVASEVLQLRFVDEDQDRFHALLAKHYADTLTAAEADELERYLYVNGLLELIRERARRSLGKTKAQA